MLFAVSRTTLVYLKALMVDEIPHNLMDFTHSLRLCERNYTLR